MKKLNLLLTFCFSLGLSISYSQCTSETAAHLNINDVPATLPNGITATQITSEGCSLFGISLYGKVQIVDAFPDIKVQIVDAFPDIKVKWVDAFPSDCGKWQKVDAFPDFKIQLVDAFPDLKVQEVDAFPGMD